MGHGARSGRRDRGDVCGRRFHPPAGINPLIITTAHATPEFIVVPVGVGALILVAYAWIYHA
jgi:CBS-domain-containing membrane protein